MSWTQTLEPETWDLGPKTRDLRLGAWDSAPGTGACDLEAGILGIGLSLGPGTWDMPSVVIEVLYRFFQLQ